MNATLERHRAQPFEKKKREVTPASGAATSVGSSGKITEKERGVAAASGAAISVESNRKLTRSCSGD